MMELTPTKTTDLGLTSLAERINDEHRLAEDAARSAVEHAVKAGELLIEAKGKVAHGEWGDWVKANCSFAERTTQVYMRVARELPKLNGSKAQRVADLPLREAVRALAEPKEPEDEAAQDCSDSDLFQAVLSDFAVREQGTNVDRIAAHDGVIPTFDEEPFSITQLWRARMESRMEEAKDDLDAMQSISEEARRVANAAVSNLCAGIALVGALDASAKGQQSKDFLDDFARGERVRRKLEPAEPTAGVPAGSTA